jgi:hypothetical protein
MIALEAETRVTAKVVKGRIPAKPESMDPRLLKLWLVEDLVRGHGARSLGLYRNGNPGIVQPAAPS